MELQHYNFLNTKLQAPGLSPATLVVLRLILTMSSRDAFDLVLRLFGPMVWKLLIIDPTSQRKLNKIESFIGFSGHSWCCWKALGK
jgi:hypothetical protein